MNDATERRAPFRRGVGGRCRRRDPDRSPAFAQATQPSGGKPMTYEAKPLSLDPKNVRASPRRSCEPREQPCRRRETAQRDRRAALPSRFSRRPTRGQRPRARSRSPPIDDPARNLFRQLGGGGRRAAPRRCDHARLRQPRSLAHRVPPWARRRRRLRMGDPGLFAARQTAGHQRAPTTPPRPRAAGRCWCSTCTSTPIT